MEAFHAKRSIFDLIFKPRLKFDDPEIAQVPYLYAHATHANAIQKARIFPASTTLHLCHLVLVVPW